MLQFMQVSTLLAVRIVFVLFCLVVLVFSWFSEGNIRWLIFLTNWNFLLLVLTQLFITALTFMDVFMEHRHPGANREWCWYHSVFRVMFSMLGGLTLTVTLLYWTVLTPRTSLLSVVTHAINAVVFIVEIALSNIVISALHLIYPIIIGIIYLIFSVIYTVSGGGRGDGEPYIYKVLDWNATPGLAFGLSIAALVLCVIFHFIVYGMYRLRTLVVQRSSDSVKPLASNDVSMGAVEKGSRTERV